MTLDENLSFKGALRAILFASGQPVQVQRLSDFFETDPDTVKQRLDEIKQDLEDGDSGVMLSCTQDGTYRLCTKPEYGQTVSNYLSQRRTQAISNAAMEVLAVAAYNQPATKTYISQVRGVNSAEIVDNLVEKGLLETAGRLDLPGRPMSYRTSAKFLTVFGLGSLEQLPQIESFLDPAPEPDSTAPEQADTGFSGSGSDTEETADPADPGNEIN